MTQRYTVAPGATYAGGCASSTLDLWARQRRPVRLTTGHSIARPDADGDVRIRGEGDCFAWVNVEFLEVLGEPTATTRDALAAAEAEVERLRAALAAENAEILERAKTMHHVIHPGVEGWAEWALLTSDTRERYMSLARAYVEK